VGDRGENEVGKRYSALETGPKSQLHERKTEGVKTSVAGGDEGGRNRGNDRREA